jgi:hypothetical protein
MHKLIRSAAFLLVLLPSSACVCCESGGGGGDSDGDSDFVGTWAIYDQSSNSSTPWYIHFQPDGIWYFSSEPDGQGSYSEYTVNDGLLEGYFTHAGVGDGKIEATISDGVLNLSFIEYWHSPANVVPYSGTKL